MKKILVLAVLTLLVLSATFASGVIEGIKYPVVTTMPTVEPAPEPKADLAAAVEAVKAEPAPVEAVKAEPAPVEAVKAEPAPVEAVKAEPAPVAEPAAAPVAVAPAALAKGITALDSIVAKNGVESFSPEAFWRQVVCTEEMAGVAADLFLKANVVVLSSEEAVVTGVRNGQFLIGILPADAATPEGCVAQVVIK